MFQHTKEILITPLPASPEPPKETERQWRNAMKAAFPKAYEIGDNVAYRDLTAVFSLPDNLSPEELKQAVRKVCRGEYA